MSKSVNFGIQGTKYFECLLEMLQRVYQFVLKDHFTAQQQQQEQCPDSVSLAVNSCRKIHSYMANLAHYRKIILNSRHFLTNQ